MGINCHYKKQVFYIEKEGDKLPLQKAKEVLTNKELNKAERSLLLIAQFVIWRERCSRIFTDKSNEIEQLIQQIQDQWTITMATSRHAIT